MGPTLLLQLQAWHRPGLGASAWALVPGRGLAWRQWGGVQSATRPTRRRRHQRPARSAWPACTPSPWPPVAARCRCPAEPSSGSRLQPGQHRLASGLPALRPRHGV